MWVTHDHGALVIAPQGMVTDKLDDSLAELERLTGAVNKADEAGELLVIADLSDVTFMNSTGLGTLVMAYVHTKNRGGRFVCCSVSKRIEHLFEITKLSLVFERYPNRATARQALGLE